MKNDGEEVVPLGEDTKLHTDGCQKGAFSSTCGLVHAHVEQTHKGEVKLLREEGLAKPCGI